MASLLLPGYGASGRRPYLGQPVLNRASWQAQGLLFWAPPTTVGMPYTQNVGNANKPSLALRDLAGNRTPSLNNNGADGLAYVGLGSSGRGFEGGPTYQQTQSDGVTFADFGDSSWFPTAASCSFALWYRKTDTTLRASIAAGIVNGADGERFGVHLPYSDGIVYFDFGGFTEGVTRLSVAWTADTVPHLWVFTVGLRGMEIWRDGALIASNGATPTRSSTTGQFRYGSGLGTGGDIAEFGEGRVYNYQLSAAQVMALYANPWDLHRVTGRRVFFDLAVPDTSAVVSNFNRNKLRPRIFAPGLAR